MSILKRFSDIMKSNINALLDKAEDPGKMIDQMLRDARDNLAQVKAETASVMANEKAAQRAVDECRDQISKYQTAAANAVSAGNDGDARTLLTRKQEQEAKLAGLEQNLAAATANADKMRQMYNKLTGDIAQMESRRDVIQGKLATAKAQEAVNKVTSAGAKTGAAMGAFDRMEAAVNKRLDSAEAAAELDAGADNDAEKLAVKYGAGSTASVEDELAALKAQLRQDA